MNRDTRFSDEFLNAFVDDEITFEERNFVHARLGRDEVLNRRVCELRRLHDLIQLAYRHLSPPSQARSPRERRRSDRRRVDRSSSW